jgi:hypothetical protein
MSLHTSLWDLGSAIGKLGETLCSKAHSSIEAAIPDIDRSIKQHTTIIKKTAKDIKRGNSKAT